MPTVQAPVQLTVEHLLRAVDQLSPAELREFRQKVGKRQKRNGRKMEKGEGALLTSIRENSHLPAEEHHRYQRLRRKCEQGNLTEKELAEYQSLLQQLEKRSVRRVQALIALAKARGQTLRGIMAELGLKGDEGDAI